MDLVSLTVIGPTESAFLDDVTDESVEIVCRFSVNTPTVDAGVEHAESQVLLPS